MENKIQYKVNLGGDLVSGVVNRGYNLKNCCQTLSLVHPQFPNIKLIALASADLESRYSYDSAAIFCSEVRKRFNSLKDCDFEVSGVSDSEEYSEVSMLDVTSRIMTSVGRQIQEMNSKEKVSSFESVKPYSLSATIVVTDGIKVGVTTVGDTRCYYTKDGVVRKISRSESLSDLNDVFSNSELIKMTHRACSKPVCYVGEYTALVQPSVTILDYMDLDSIILMSKNGYSKMSDEALEQAIKNCDSEFIAESLVCAATEANRQSLDMGVIALSKESRKKLVHD